MRKSLINSAKKLLKKYKSSNQEVLVAKPIGKIEVLKNKIFGQKEVEIIDIEAVEVVSAQMQTQIDTLLLENPSEQHYTDTHSIEATEIQNNTTISEHIEDTAKDLIFSTNQSPTTTWDNTIDKAKTIKQITLDLSSATKNTLVRLSKQANQKYNEIQTTAKFDSLLSTIDLVTLISVLQAFKQKQVKTSKQYIALGSILSLLTILQQIKKQSPERIGDPKASEELNQRMQDLLNSTNFKEVVQTAEPILLQIPKGNYILIVLKLFV